MIKAVDLGYGSIKAIGSARQVEYPSAIGTFRPIRFTSGMEAQELKDRLCVEFEGRQYFIGDIAFTQTVPRVTMNSKRFYELLKGLALMMSALMLLANSQLEEIRLVAGLPVNEYARLKDEYNNTLKGSHYIQLISTDGKESEFYRFDIEEVKILPQPIGTIFNAVLDDAGQLSDKRLAGGRLAVLDIGKHTVDLALTDGLVFIDKSSTSYNDLGLFESFKDISLALKGAGYDIAPDSIEPYIRSNRTLPGLPQIKEQAFASLAERIVSRVINAWPDLFTFDSIYITGGGAEVVGSYIAEALDSNKVIISDSATMTNCQGFYKYGKRVFK
jgi:plasmid segregation protein ParM